MAINKNYSLLEMKEFEETNVLQEAQILRRYVRFNEVTDIANILTSVLYFAMLIKQDDKHGDGGRVYDNVPLKKEAQAAVFCEAIKYIAM